MKKTIATVGIMILSGSLAQAQQTSLMKRDLSGAVTLPSASLVYSEALRPREPKLNDLVTIRVTEISTFINSGDSERRKISSIDARLQNWLQLDGLNLKAADTTGTDLPRARGSYNETSRNEGEVNANELLKLNITARIVDIRPNGNLVLEARKSVQVDEEIIESSLTGIVRRDDVQPDNVIMSDKIAELAIKRNTVGQVRDSYKRGWLSRFWDGVNPF